MHNRVECYNKQFGFRKNHSTTHYAIIEVVDKITEALDQRKITIGKITILDLSNWCLI